MTIQLMLNIGDDMGLKSIVYEYNDTDLPSNGETLGMIATAILRALKHNKDSVLVQDLLIELDIKTTKE